MMFTQWWIGVEGLTLIQRTNHIQDAIAQLALGYPQNWRVVLYG